MSSGENINAPNVHAPRFLPPAMLDWSLPRSLFENLKELLRSRKNPRTRQQSRPVPVQEVWGQFNNYRSTGTYTSVIVHALLIGAIMVGTLLGPRVAEMPKRRETITYIAPYEAPVILSPSKQEVAGGGGGGDHDRIEAPKGRLPKKAMVQITPPAIVVRNDHPKLAVEPAVVVPPQVRIADNRMPNLGNPVAAAMPAGPPSNGTGSGGGIGSGLGGGVGSGSGPGVGPGRGGGVGGGVFRVGGGISAPRPISTPDPEYTEAARQAKYQGTCILGLIVDADGHPRDIRITRGIGLGLDEKAIAAVKQWQFQPAMKDGHPVAVLISVEVSFKLY
jgi:protein TonB